MLLPAHRNSPRLARDSLVLGPSAALNRDPTSATQCQQPFSNTYVFHSNPQHLNLYAWCLGVDSSKNKASLWRWQRELLPLKSHQQGPPNKSKWALFEKWCRENSVDFFLCQCISQQSTASQPPCLVSRSGQLREQGISVGVAERITAPQRS